nr:hypothetical protein GBIVDUHS_GBIVDUHS_CDS_0005 [Microvirus sp.]
MSEVMEIIVANKCESGAGFRHRFRVVTKR